MAWKLQLADRCEIELLEIRRLWRKCEDISEWSNEEAALDDWRDGDRTQNIFALVIVFQDEFSILRCVERECRKIDELLLELERVPGSSLQALGNQTTDGSTKAYSLCYFRENKHQWSKCFQEIRKSREKTDLVVCATADFALLDVLEEAWESCSRLWQEWGSASFDIEDGIQLRIQALRDLESQCLTKERPKTSTIRDLRDEIRRKNKLIKTSSLRRRRVIKRNASSTNNLDTGNAGGKKVASPKESKRIVQFLPVHRWLKPMKSTVFHCVRNIQNTSIVSPKHKQVLKALEMWFSKQSTNIFTIHSVVVFVSSGGLVMLSILTHTPMWVGFSQMMLLIYQACSVLQGRLNIRKQQRDEEKSFVIDTTQTSTFFCICVAMGALAASISAIVYPFATWIATVFSFVANLCQVIGTISVSQRKGSGARDAED